MTLLGHASIATSWPLFDAVGYCWIPFAVGSGCPWISLPHLVDELTLLREQSHDNRLSNQPVIPQRDPKSVSTLRVFTVL